MRANRISGIVVLGVLLLLTAQVHQIEPAGQPGPVLLTPEEAQQLWMADEDWQSRPRLRGLPRGPRVLVQRPPVRDTEDGPIIETAPPMDFVVFFEQNVAPVNMDSLEIKARKGLFSMSLTPRLKPYISGSSLEAQGLTIPEGKFLIQIEIEDTAGARTVQSYRLEVKRARTP